MAGVIKTAIVFALSNYSLTSRTTALCRPATATSTIGRLSSPFAVSTRPNSRPGLCSPGGLVQPRLLFPGGRSRRPRGSRDRWILLPVCARRRAFARLDALLFSSLMMAYFATCCSTKAAVMTDQMACHAADYCSFDAAFGVSRYRSASQQ